MSFAIGLALALSGALSGIPSAQALSIQTHTFATAQSVEEYVRSYFADEPVLVAIARCESRFIQFDRDGSVHRGVVNNKDVGVMQVNEYYHSKVAEKLGLDIYTIQGNVAYAHYLYTKEGTAPWNSSKPCWGKSKEHKEHLALAEQKKSN